MAPCHLVKHVDYSPQYTIKTYQVHSDTKWTSLCRWRFQNYFLMWELSFCGSAKILASNRRQVIISSSNRLIYRRACASFGLDKWFCEICWPFWKRYRLTCEWEHNGILNNKKNKDWEKNMRYLTLMQCSPWCPGTAVAPKASTFYRHSDDKVFAPDATRWIGGCLSIALWDLSDVSIVLDVHDHKFAGMKSALRNCTHPAMLCVQPMRDVVTM